MKVSFGEEWTIPFTPAEEVLARRMAGKRNMSVDQYIWEMSPDLVDFGLIYYSGEDIRESVLRSWQRVYPLAELCSVVGDISYAAGLIQDRSFRDARVDEDRKILLQDDLMKAMGISAICGYGELPVSPRIYLGPGGVPFIMTPGEKEDAPPVPVLLGDSGNATEKEWAEAIAFRRYRINREMGRDEEW